MSLGEVSNAEDRGEVRVPVPPRLAQAESPQLPAWTSVLVVVAHPDDESLGLGAVLDAFVGSGAQVSVLCFTPGGASTTTGVAGDLSALRAVEYHQAAQVLGVGTAVLAQHPAGQLGRSETLAREVIDAASRASVDGLLVFDPSGVTGHPDHAAATAAALEAADALGLPVLGWTLPADVAHQLNHKLGTTFIGTDPAAIDIVLPVDRDRQHLASLAHASQAIPTGVLWRRLEFLGGVEHLRWLRPEAAPRAALRVDHRGGDRFDITIRDHVVTVDQPVTDGGEDLGPSPTELFVASIAACVGFYASRYLRRHGLDDTGLLVRATYQLATKPARVSDIDLDIELTTQLPLKRREGLMAVARHCTVHNSLTEPPDVTISLTRPVQDHGASDRDKN
jgi:LmbE family N-acetylglucosaminyl deacetylase/uncharacterized OsmC-like protein